jgi:phosphatidylglycerophosphate synthase
MPAKPLVTDEPVDRWFSRPLARLLVGLLARTPLTANQVTGVGTCFGIGSGVALGLGEGAWCAALIVVLLVLDCADGQLARLRGVGGYLGRVVDGVGDYLTGISIHVGLILWLARTHDPATAAFLGVAAGASMTWTSFLLDRYKRRWGGRADDLDAVRAEMEGYRGWRRFVMATFLPYASRVAVVGIADLDAYRERARTPLLFFLAAGPTNHLTLLAVLAALELPLAYVAAACVPFNLAAVVGLLLQRDADRVVARA